MLLTQASLPVRLSLRDPANFDLFRRCLRGRRAFCLAHNWMTSAQNMTVVQNFYRIFLCIQRILSVGHATTGPLIEIRMCHGRWGLVMEQQRP